MSLELLSLGLDFVGGLMGRSSARKQQAQAASQFRQQMDESVQRRVADAKKAGIHPLFALGANVGSSPTISTNQPDSSMQTALGTMANTLNKLETNKAQAARDHAQAALFDSERKRIEQSLNAQQDGGAKTYPYDWKVPEAGEPIYQLPEVATAKPGTNRSVETGVHPRWRPYRRSDGSTGLAFAESVAGSEELNTFWIPLQDWWHTSKQARKKIRRRLGITESQIAYLRSDPELALRFIRQNSEQIRSLKRELANFHKATSGRPIR